VVHPVSFTHAAGALGIDDLYTRIRGHLNKTSRCRSNQHLAKREHHSSVFACIALLILTRTTHRQHRFHSYSHSYRYPSLHPYLLDSSPLGSIIRYLCRSPSTSPLFRAIQSLTPLPVIIQARCRTSSPTNVLSVLVRSTQLLARIASVLTTVATNAKWWIYLSTEHSADRLLNSRPSLT
jgi:hypothetical protein